MSKLIQVYGNACGLKIGDPYMYEEFFPLDEGMYITIQGGSGQISKVYDYANDFLDVLGPILNNNKIKIYQLGGKDDVPLKNCIHLQGQTTINQAYYLIRNAICHIGPDSWMTHAAGWMRKPLVAYYGSTSVQNHGCYWLNHNQTALIESHRRKNLPTYSQESTKAVNFIRPEEIINAVLKILGGNAQIDRQSYLFGAAYTYNVVEWVPNFMLDPNLLKDQPVAARLDYAKEGIESEQLLINVLQTRPLNIITNRQINLEWVRHLKGKIITINYEINAERDTVDYIRELKKTGAKVRVYSKEQDEKKLADLRFKFLDVTLIEKLNFKAKQNFWEESEAYLDYKIDKDNALKDNVFYRSNKFILSEGKIFLSKAALKANIATNGFENNIMSLIDTDDFWEEMDHFYIFKQKIT